MPANAVFFAQLKKYSKDYQQATTFFFEACSLLFIKKNTIV
jgi:hypothetical protein